ncbi:hypothetical protein KR038_010973, partial [Drosophila bunnanda]
VISILNIYFTNNNECLIGLFRVEFTNVNCTSFDRDFCNFEYCHLKSVNRSYKYLSIKVNLYEVPVNNFKINLTPLLRLNGYKPFLYNVTVDGCKFLKNPKSYPVSSYLFNVFGSFTNINHTCPIDHDLILDKLSAQFVNHQLTAVLPVPEGKYALQTSWFANNTIRATVTAFVTLS